MGLKDETADVRAELEYTNSKDYCKDPEKAQQLDELINRLLSYCDEVDAYCDRMEPDVGRYR